jgi:hypothetical protein
MSLPLTNLVAEMRATKAKLYAVDKYDYNGYATACGDWADKWEAALAKARELCYDKDTLSKLVSIEWVLRDIIGEQKKGTIEQARNPTG